MAEVYGASELPTVIKDNAKGCKTPGAFGILTRDSYLRDSAYQKILYFEYKCILVKEGIKYMCRY